MAEPRSSSSRAGDVTASSASSGPNLRLYALCGVMAPVFWLLMVIVESLLQPGYNQVSQYISDLGNYALYGSYAILQNLNFWIFGVLVIIFALGLRQALPQKSITVSLVLFGIAIFVSGIFTDQPPPPGKHVSVHDLAGDVAFLSIALCQFFAWRRLRHTTVEEESAWSRYRNYSLVSGVITLILLVNLGVAEGSNSVFVGLAQRAFFTVPWLWIEIMALRLFRLSNQQPR